MSSATPARFHDLWVRHAGEVYRFALYLSGDAAVAEDVTSEAFLRVWAARERVEFQTVRAYLFAIARNVYFHELRRARRETALDAALPSPRSLARAAESRQELAQALEAMRQLPEIDRAALLLRAEEGLTYEEIAAILRLPVASARVKVHRARLRLAQICQRRSATCP